MTRLLMLLLLLPSLAFAQGGVVQSQPVTAGHAVEWLKNGVVKDGGPAGGGVVGVGLSELLRVAIGTGNPPYAGTGTGPQGTNDCNYDGPITSAAGFHYLCFSPNAQGGGLIDYGASGPATPLPLYMMINGTKYQFPFVLSGVVGPSTSVIGDLACWNNTAGTLLSDCGVLGSSLVAGPASSVSGDVATFSGTSGKLIQDSGTLLSSLAPKASPALTGTPTAPTASVGTNTTQIATTAFVKAGFAGLGNTNTYTGNNYFGSDYPWVDVRAYGAVGDNSTDDSAAFAAAIAVVQANASHGMLYIPPGTYCLFSGMSITGLGVWVHGAGGSNFSSVISACGHNVTVLTMNGFSEFADHIFVIGDSAITTTQPAIFLGSSCVECVIGYSRVIYGLYNILNTGNDNTLHDIHAESAYGTAVIKLLGNAYLHRVKADQGWPGAVPAYGTSFGARATSTSYGTNAIVTSGGFYIQATTGGTSGGGSLTLLGYGQPMTDGSVTWQLVAPVSYYSLQIDSNSFDVLDDNGDHTGPFNAGILLTDSLSTGGPQSTIVRASVFGQNFTAGIDALVGAGLVVDNGSQFANCILAGCAGVTTGASWSGNLSVGNILTFGNGYGVLISGGSHNVVTGGAQIHGSVVAGVEVTTGVTDFTITGIDAGGSATWGGNAIGIQVSAGASDWYNITNNLVHGSTIGVSDGGSGTHKTISGNN